MDNKRLRLNNLMREEFKGWPVSSIVLFIFRSDGSRENIIEWINMPGKLTGSIYRPSKGLIILHDTIPTPVCYTKRHTLRTIDL